MWGRNTGCAGQAHQMGDWSGPPWLQGSFMPLERMPGRTALRLDTHAVGVTIERSVENRAKDSEGVNSVVI